MPPIIQPIGVVMIVTPSDIKAELTAVIAEISVPTRVKAKLATAEAAEANAESSDLPRVAENLIKALSAVIIFESRDFPSFIARPVTLEPTAVKAESTGPERTKASLIKTALTMVSDVSSQPLILSQCL